MYNTHKKFSLRCSEGLISYLASRKSFLQAHLLIGLSMSCCITIRCDPLSSFFALSFVACFFHSLFLLDHILPPHFWSSHVPPSILYLIFTFLTTLLPPSWSVCSFHCSSIITPLVYRFNFKVFHNTFISVI